MPRMKDLENPPTVRSEECNTARSRAGTLASLVVTDEDCAEKLRHHFDYPEMGELVGMQVGMSLGYIAYTTTAWLYIGSVRHEIFPDCDHIWSEPLMRWGCETTVLAFWTFPL